MRYLTFAAFLGLAACGPVPLADVTKSNPLDTMTLLPLPAMKSFLATVPTATSRNNRQIAEDFLDLEFSLESGRILPVLTRFDGPVTVKLQGKVPAFAAEDLGLVMARMRTEAGISIDQVTAQDASITIEFLPRKQLQALVPTAACFVAPRVTSWEDYRKNRKTGVLDWTTLTRREHLAIFIPSDTSPQEVRDCLHEELAQSMGPLNDLYRLPDSVFNDDNFQAVLTGFDMLILRLHYSADLQNGMTKAEVAVRLPMILAKLNPKGELGMALAQDPTPRPWIDAIEAALGPKGSDSARLKAAERALAIAKAEGWTDNRLAFSYFAAGRLNLGNNLPRAIESFATASKIYQGLPDGPVHIAHVDMQMAAFALSSGQPNAVIDLANRSIPVAYRAQNAALLATFMLLKAQALDQLGRGEEARSVRLDSLGWARYGFGPDKDVRARLSDIAALSAVKIGG
jgi:hypothetical protein